MTSRLRTAGSRLGKSGLAFVLPLCAVKLPRCHVVADWAQRLPAITEGYQPTSTTQTRLASTFGRSRTGRWLCATILVRHRKIESVLLACSADGDKFKPLVIAKSENPRCFRGITKVAFPVIYRANKTAWMTTIMFKEWLERLNGRMTLQSRNILLVVDDCGAHPAVHLSNVEIVFLPPNTTSRLQPCDAGIIANVKALYRKRWLRHVLAQIDEASSASDLAKRVNILDAIAWLHLAWTGVTGHG